jgi:hypothetical protein
MMDGFYTLYKDEKYAMLCHASSSAQLAIMCQCYFYPHTYARRQPFILKGR